MRLLHESYLVISDKSIRGKVAWSNFKQVLLGLKGGGQESGVMTQYFDFL